MSSTATRAGSGPVDGELVVGALVDVRGRKWVVSEVVPAARSTCVTLQSVETASTARRSM